MKCATGLSGWVYSKRDGLSFFSYTGKTPEIPSHRITYRAYKVLAESRSRTSFLNKDTITIWDRIIVSL